MKPLQRDWLSLGASTAPGCIAHTSVAWYVSRSRRTGSIVVGDLLYVGLRPYWVGQYKTPWINKSQLFSTMLYLNIFDYQRLNSLYLFICFILRQLTFYLLT